MHMFYFCSKRAQMILENEGVDVEERRLFHGTHTSVVESICKKGFDWRVCGKNGTVYGQGELFIKKKKKKALVLDDLGKVLFIKGFDWMIVESMRQCMVMVLYI